MTTFKQLRSLKEIGRLLDYLTTIIEYLVSSKTCARSSLCTISIPVILERSEGSQGKIGVLQTTCS